jgi:phosphogluconate dehydratase
MSGASGKVPAAIHVSPEVLAGGPLGRVRDGDMILVDAEKGMLQALVPDAEWRTRTNEAADLSANHVGMGRELFAMFRATVSTAEEGAATFGLPPPLHLPEEHDNPLAVPEEQSFSDEDSLITRK